MYYFQNTSYKKYMYNYVLFDLDGTLVDSSEGILNSAQYALNQCGVKEDNIERLKVFIGPPLKETFIAVYGMSEEQATHACNVFRMYYSEKGKLQCHLYDDIVTMLSTLKKSGKTLIVATSKPTVFSQDILDRLQISQFFDDIVGSNMDNSRSKKSEIINYILEKYRIEDKSQVVMVGDKSHDLIGASQCGISAIGVSYGFGTVEELLGEPHEKIVDTTRELLEILR